MATILEQVKRLEKLSEKAIVSELFKALKDAEKLVLELNKGQLKNNESNERSVFKHYHPKTQSYWRFENPPIDESYKVTSNRYNFEWSGEFLKGLNLTIEGEEGVISSTGMDGEKQVFIESSNAIGLNDDNLKILIKTKLLPHINNFARTTLKI